MISKATGRSLNMGAHKVASIRRCISLSEFAPRSTPPAEHHDGADRVRLPRRGAGPPPASGRDPLGRV